jgi:TRAP-type C4-dicarboxylate transport system substrate-binding protein
LEPIEVGEEDYMNLTERHFFMRATAAAAAMIVLSLTVALDAAQAQDKTYVMKITLPTLNDPSHLFAKNYAAAIERDSRGRIKTEIYPASQLGAIPRQIEATQFGAIQCAIIPPEFFVGVDERFEVMSAPGLVDSLEHAHRLTLDPAPLKLILGLGADKGLHGAGLFLNGMSSVIAKKAIRSLSDFKGKKIRTLASKFQTEPFNRLGATPVVMTLGDVLLALQQGTIDASIGSIVIFNPMRFQDAAKFVTETGQPPVFVVVEISKKWYDSLPAELQKIIDGNATTEAVAIHPHMVEIYNNARKSWINTGGELISLPPDEQAMMLKTLSSVGADVSSTNPSLSEAYKIVTAAAQRTR